MYVDQVIAQQSTIENFVASIKMLINMLKLTNEQQKKEFWINRAWIKKATLSIYKQIGEEHSDEGQFEYLLFININ